jgi:hypothetical protein
LGIVLAETLSLGQNSDSCLCNNYGKSKVEGTRISSQLFFTPVPNFKVERILPQNFTTEFRSSLKLKLIPQSVSKTGDLLSNLRRDKLWGDGELSLTEIIMARIAIMQRKNTHSKD